MAYHIRAQPIGSKALFPQAWCQLGHVLLRRMTGCALQQIAARHVIEQGRAAELDAAVQHRLMLVIQRQVVHGFVYQQTRE